jgi:hypothetical protein
MVDLNDELLSAYLDGELDQFTRTAVSALLAGSPEARARLDALRIADATLKAALPLEPAPAGAMAILQSGKVLAFPTRAKRTRAAIAASAMAAAAALAIVAIPSLSPNATTPARGPGLARDALAQALEARPSGAAEHGVRIVASLQAADGRFCREYERTNGTRIEQGLACRSADGWAMVASHSAPAATGYQTAGADGAIDEAIDKLDAAALEPNEEALLLARKWRP